MRRTRRVCHSRRALCTALAAAALASAVAGASAPPAPLPHLVFVLADDLGFAAPGYRNAQLVTPALDALAASGVILDSHYAYKFCSPSRGSLLSGRWPFKLESTRNNLIPFSQEDGLNVNMTLLPARLKETVPPYATAHVGKHHLGLWRPEFTPTRRGFDSSDGFLAGGQDHFTSLSFGECGCKQYDIFVNGSAAPRLQGEYTGFRFAAAAVRAIEGHDASGGRPLFLYVALQNTHGPLQAEKQFEALYPGVTYNKQLAFDGMISTVDSAVANITAALVRKGFWNNTVLVWASDNGAPVEVGGSNWPLRGSKGGNFEGGVRTPAFVAGGLVPAAARGTRRAGIVHLADWFATLVTLAGLDPAAPDGSAVPVDGVNAWPYIVGVNTTPPRTRLVHAHDLFSGTAVGALRDGDYKLIVENTTMASWYGDDSVGHFSPPQNGSLPNPSACSVAVPCLFNIAEDPRETTDLAAAMPAKVAELLAIFHGYDSEHHPPQQAPPMNAAACCAAGAKAGGYLVPWG